MSAVEEDRAGQGNAGEESAHLNGIVRASLLKRWILAKTQQKRGSEPCQSVSGSRALRQNPEEIAASLMRNMTPGAENVPISPAETRAIWSRKGARAWCPGVFFLS